MSEGSDLHKGHRQRLFNKFLQNGINCLEDHEVLEIILFSIMPRCNTNEMSHMLINEFGSLGNVFRAEYSDLLRVKGVGNSAAAYIRFLGDFISTYDMRISAKEIISLNTTKKLLDFCKRLLRDRNRECFYILCLDSMLNLVACDLICEGSADTIVCDLKTIIYKCIERRCSILVLTHNHPNSAAIFSKADVSATRQIAQSLTMFDIRLFDHILVGSDSQCSMKESNILKDIWP